MVPSRTWPLTLLVILASLALPRPVQAEIPLMISYQGKVTDTGGAPVADGPYSMQFRIYEVDEGGSPLWDSGARTVTVVGGIFSVLLGESPQPALGLQFQVDLWLEVVIEGDVQSPRRPLASVGYAYMASGLVPGTEVVGAVHDGGAFTAFNTEASDTAYGVSGQIESTEGSGVWGHAVSTTGDVCGVKGTSDSDDGVGVYGEGARGVYAVSTSTWGAGVYARTTATAGQTAGVQAWCGSPDGYGVHGEGYTGVQGWTITTTG
ncbi:hypothetical protein JXA88_19460, partial [Candidatus Fermentibacteria bacterium]|nr:hypothetical protein [Candidatus Fermentibacteria bacterium]